MLKPVPGLDCDRLFSNRLPDDDMLNPSAARLLLLTFPVKTLLLLPVFMANPFHPLNLAILFCHVPPELLLITNPSTAELSLMLSVKVLLSEPVWTYAP